MHRALGQAAVDVLLGLEKRDLSGLGGYFVDTQSHGTSRFEVWPIITRRGATSNTVLSCAGPGSLLRPAPDAQPQPRYAGNPPTARRPRIVACAHGTPFAHAVSDASRTPSIRRIRAANANLARFCPDPSRASVLAAARAAARGCRPPGSAGRKRGRARRSRFCAQPRAA